MDQCNRRCVTTASSLRRQSDLDQHRQRFITLEGRQPQRRALEPQRHGLLGPLVVEGPCFVTQIALRATEHDRPGDADDLEHRLAFQLERGARLVVEQHRLGSCGRMRRTARERRARKSGQRTQSDVACLVQSSSSVERVERHPCRLLLSAFAIRPTARAEGLAIEPNLHGKLERVVGPRPGNDTVVRSALQARLEALLQACFVVVRRRAPGACRAHAVAELTAHERSRAARTPPSR